MEPEETTTPEDTGINPAWSEALSAIPDEFHGTLTEHFQKWDQAAQSKIESVNSSLKDFEPYKPFVEHGITSDEIEQGLRLMYELNNNPQGVYEALANAYKFGQSPESSATGDDDEDDDDIPEGIDPNILEKLDQQEGILKAVSQIVLADAEAKQNALEDQKLDKELSDLAEKYGEYDERYVLAMMQNGMSGEEAVKSFKELQSSVIKSQPYAPQILGSSGGSGVPSNAIDPTKLSGKETRNLVAQMLAAANKQQQGG